MTAAGTIGTTPGPIGKPRPRSSIHRITPAAASSPYAEPPVSSTASTRPARPPGTSACSSRVPVARPTTAAAPRSGASIPRTTVSPVAPSPSVAWPTATPNRVRSTVTARSQRGPTLVLRGHRRDLRRRAVLRLLGADAAVQHPAEVADEADERAAVAARVAFRRALLAPAGAADHRVSFVSLGHTVSAVSGARGNGELPVVSS